ncbi:unnamed protein product [Phytomonas sp. EM1]|nr:unnamed protein product [Phytomonas sp. EM1]|eukprot:CCW64074.1 unnamed protein product [Phytomonas sp. isolate EM1]
MPNACTLSPQDVASVLVKLTSSVIDEIAASKSDINDYLPEYSSNALDTVQWSSRISCGAMPCCLPVLGDPIAFFEPNQTPGVVRAHINNREHFLLHKKRIHNLLGFLHVSAPSSRLLLQRSGDFFQYSLTTYSVQASESISLESSFEMLKREIVLWIMQASATTVGKTKQTKLAEIESKFPFLLLLSPTQRVDYLAEAIDTYAHGAIVWFDKTAIVETGLPTCFCTDVGTKGDRRRVSALRLALDHASSLGNYDRIEKLCNALRVILEMLLKSANVVMSEQLLKCLGIAFQVMSPFINEGLKITERPPLTLTTQLDLILDYCNTGDIGKLMECFDSKKKSQKRRTDGLSFLVSVLQHTSRHRRCSHVNSESICVRPKPPLAENASAFFASVLPPESSQHTPTTLAIDGCSLKSTLIDQWDGDKIRAVSLLPDSQPMNIRRKVLSELVLSIHSPAHLLLRNSNHAEENAELKLFMGKHARGLEESVFDDTESYALSIIRQRAFSKRSRNER